MVISMASSILSLLNLSYFSCFLLAVKVTAFAPASSTVTQLTDVTFVELSGEIVVNEGEPVALRCLVNTRVDMCQWLWRPLGDNDAEPIPVKNFTPALDQGRDCSVRFPAVLKEQQGLWSCAVKGVSNTHFVDAPPTSLQLLPPVKLHFLEVPENTTVALGHSTILPCVATSPVNHCLWTWYPVNDTESGVKVKEFPGFGNYSRDCSMHFKEVQKEQDGYWKCSIRIDLKDNILEAESSVARLTTFVSESVMVAIRTAPSEKISLACQLSTPRPMANCVWKHHPNIVVSERNHTERYIVHKSDSTGMCTLTMDPKPEDLGQWRCIYIMTTSHGKWEIAAATIILLTTNYITDKTMDWIVGVLACLVILLTILVMVILMCKRKSSSRKKDSLGNPSISSLSEKEKSSRYTEHPSKINFQFGEGPVSTNTSTTNQSSDSNHIYEPVDRYLSPSCSKSIYENVK